MKVFNSHTHTLNSHDGKGTVEENAVEAIKSGLFGFAVTDHCDCEYANDPAVSSGIGKSYSDTLKAKEKYRDSLYISCGIEIGEALFNPDFANDILGRYEWDVVLGSVHAVRFKNYEMPFSIIDFSSFSDEMITAYVTSYFNDLLETALLTDYDILSHLTVILRYIVYRYKKQVDITAYTPVICKILKAVISRDKTLELNTSGINDGYFMPDRDILMMYSLLGGKRVSLGSDSHNPRNISSGLAAGVSLLRETGFSAITVYKNRMPFEYEI